MPRKAQLNQGELVNGSYLVLSKIGEGGMGSVYKVEHSAIKRICALKTIDIARDQGSDAGRWRNFQQEAKLISRLSHKNIVHVYDFGVTEGDTAFYVMDFIEGKTLLETVHKQGQLDLRQALAIFVEVAEGLACAHSQRLVHRDIKPSNIMVAGGEGGAKFKTVKIIDFGLAMSANQDAEDMTVAGGGETNLQIVGSPPYMSPEQYQNGIIDFRSDIYSFGCTLFEALTGVPPFLGDSALILSMKHLNEAPPSLAQASLGRDFPAELEMIASRLLAKDPDQRYQDMKIVAEDLLGVLESLSKTRSPSTAGSTAAGTGPKKAPSASIAPGQEQSFSRTFRVGMAKYALALVAVLILAAGIAAGLLLRPAPRQEAEITEPEATKATQSGGAVEATQSAGTAKTAQSSGTAEATPSGSTAKAAQSGGVVPTKQTDDAALENAGTADASTGMGNAGEPLSKEPFSRMVADRSGKKFRVFQFPDNIELGKFEDMNRKSPGWPAKGRVVFPANVPLKLTPWPIMCQTPSYFRRLRPDDLFELDLVGDATITSETVNFIDHMTGLNKLRLCQSDVDDDCLSAIEQLKGLRDLDISYTSIQGQTLAKLKNLHRLKCLHVDGLPGITPVIKALANSEVLLELHVDKTIITQDDVKTIAALKHLRNLSVCSTYIGLSGLEILSKSPELQTLSILSNGYTPEVVPILKKFRSLKNLEITCDTWSPAEIAAMEASLPGHTVTVSERIPIPKF